MDLVRGDVVLLAGATGRVGGATLATLLREGAAVAVISRSRARAEAAIAAALGDVPAAQALAVEADLGDPASAAAAVDACIARFGRIDALASLAGSGFGAAPLRSATLADLHANLRSFTETAYNLALPALRAMLAQPYRDGARSRGRIVAVTAGSSKDPAPGRGPFGAAKAAVNVLMQAISREHKGDGIVANAVVLGGVQTEAARARSSPEEFAAAASPQEVADVLTFLCSDRCSGLNGVPLDLNARETD